MTPGVTYWVLVSTSASFGNPIYDSMTISDTFAVLSNLSNNMKYYWEVGKNAFMGAVSTDSFTTCGCCSGPAANASGADERLAEHAHEPHVELVHRDRRDVLWRPGIDRFRFHGALFQPVRDRRFDRDGRRQPVEQHRTTGGRTRPMTVARRRGRAPGALPRWSRRAAMPTLASPANGATIGCASTDNAQLECGERRGLVLVQGSTVADFLTTIGAAIRHYRDLGGY